MMRWRVLLLAGLVAACSDMTTAPVISDDDDDAHLRIHVPLFSTHVVSVTVEVAASDIAPIVVELDIDDGTASGTIVVPAGSARTITLRAFDAADIETHRGSRTVDIEAGSNPAIAITLLPLTGQQPIEATIAEVVLVSIAPANLIFFANDTVQLAAHVVDGEGDAVELAVRWAVIQPSLVEVSPDGRAWLTDPGAEPHTATIVAALGTQVQSTNVTFMAPAGIIQLVEQELANAFLDWWRITGNPNHGAPPLSTASFQHSAFPANFGMVEFSAIPRIAITNDPAYFYYSVFNLPFEYGYRAIAAVNRALAQLEHFIERDMIDTAAEARVRAVGSYLHGVSYGALALRFDGGPLLGELTVFTQATQFTDYAGLLAHALERLDEAIAIASAHTFAVPQTVMRTDAPVTNDVLARVASSYKARLRAGVARTPPERAAVDWAAVLADIDNGITQDFGYVMNAPASFSHESLYQTSIALWSQLSYFVHGMADQSGRYQEWMGLPVEDRHPDLDGGSFFIQTPDLRFPQGETLAAQMSSPGTRFILPSNYSAAWGQSARGTWRWSYYRTAFDTLNARNGFLPDLMVAEMRLLAAEAYYMMGNPTQAAALVNMTRVAAGLNATDAVGTNTDCVPRLPDGSCGDLFEMLKWEKRLEASHTNAGFLMATWYYEGRGWGDLMEDTPLQWPIPAHLAEHFGLPVRSYGGGLDFSAPVGTYGY